MICPHDKIELRRRYRISNDMHVITNEYMSCDICGKKYDLDRNEIVLKNDNYIILKSGIKAKNVKN